MTHLLQRPTQFIKTLSLVIAASAVMFSAGLGHAYAGSTDVVSTGATTSLGDTTNNATTGTASNTSNNTSATTTTNNQNTSTSATSTVNGSTTATPAQNSSTGVSFNSKRDNDSNAILYGGAMSTSELLQKYNASDNNTRAVYSSYNISSSDIANMHTTAVAGSVQKNGNVLVNGKIVANNAISAGWHNMPGSTKVSNNGAIFYNSPPAISFIADQIDAYVVLNQNGQFVFAILASCGNPVKATNVVPAPTPVPTPAPAPAPTPTPTPAPAPAAAPAAPAELPNTGAASVAEFTGIFGAISVLGAAAHQLFIRRKAVRGL